MLTTPLYIILIIIVGNHCPFIKQGLYEVQVFPALLMKIQFLCIKQSKDCLSLKWKYYGLSKRRWIYHLTQN